MFRTVVPPGESKDKINLSDKVLCIGSCFADMVGRKLAENKFNVNINPYSIAFNPYSIFNLLEYSIENRFPPPHTYLKNQGVFYNYDLHSDFGDLDRGQLKGRIEQTIRKTAGWLSKINWLILTFGTAIVYQRTDNGETVANCHKMPSDYFDKQFLTDNEIRTGFKRLMDKLISINPQLNIILTVSPVRHIKDTLELNAVSKSILRVACHHLSENFSSVKYFPAYEIMMDDLRDYRFYKRDMIHPSEEAEDYIWKVFGKRYFSAEVNAFIKDWQKIRKSLTHRPFHVQSENHQDFLKKLLMRLHTVNDVVDVSAEIEQVEEQIEACK